jgi:hypothetical protein
MLVSFLAYFLSPKIEATRSSETSVEFQGTTQRYIQEDRTLYIFDSHNTIFWDMTPYD